MADKQEAFREPRDPNTNPSPESTNAAAGAVPVVALLILLAIVALGVIAYVVTRMAS